MENRNELNKISKFSRFELPPRLPQNEEELDLAIRMLGNRKRCELGLPAQNRLKRMLGTYPTLKQASLWKRILRRVCREQFQNV